LQYLVRAASQNENRLALAILNAKLERIELPECLAIAQTLQRHTPPYHPSEEISVFTPAVVLFGMILIVASLGLFLTSKFKPELHQESDNIYAGIGVH
jgi:Ycf66 protein N-terminus